MFLCYVLFQKFFLFSVFGCENIQDNDLHLLIYRRSIFILLFSSFFLLFHNNTGQCSWVESRIDGSRFGSICFVYRSYYNGVIGLIFLSSFCFWNHSTILFCHIFKNCCLSTLMLIVIFLHGVVLPPFEYMTTKF